MELVTDPSAAAAYVELTQRFRALARDEKVEVLRDVAASIRRDVIRTIDGAGIGHVGGDLSVTDILVTLYVGVLRLDPAQPQWPERDRFIMSKGHCAASLYSMLAHAGFFPKGALRQFMGPLSPLSGHPNRREVPGVETNTGPLGHGFPVGVGCALAAKLQRSSRRTFVVLGDGELQEGSNWESAMTASHHRLASLTVIVDRNQLQQGARTEETKSMEPLADKWTAFGFETRELDGHDYGALLDAFTPSTTGQPVAIVASTTKGKGVSFMEDRTEWHHKVPSAEQVVQALAELSA